MVNTNCDSGGRMRNDCVTSIRPRPVAFALALDQTLNSTLHAVPPVPCFPLLLGIGVVRPERSCGF